MKNPLVLRKFSLDMIKRNNLSKAKLALSKYVQNSLPSKYAQYLLNESTISYHVGHALLNNFNFTEYKKSLSWRINN